MQVEGEVLSSLKRFVDQSYGPEGYDAWMMFMPTCSSAFFKEDLVADSWYPVEKALIIPLEWMCALFHGGELARAKEFGYYLTELHPLAEKAMLRMEAPQNVLQSDEPSHLLAASEVQRALMAVLRQQQSRGIHPALENFIMGCLERFECSGEEILRDTSKAPLAQV